MNSIPEEIAHIDPEKIRDVFEHPTLIEIKGQKAEPLFLSLLLHGNETTSFYVLQKLQKYLSNKKLPRDLIIFIGNVYATEKNQRFLEDQQDYNRIWKNGSSKEHSLANEVKSIAQSKNIFASIDIHNNTGANPFYACINHLKNEYLYLGQLFSNTLVYFQNPDTAQSSVFSHLAPSVTLECGQSAKKEGTEKAFQYIIDVINHESLNHPKEKLNVNIFETMARISIHKDVSFGFDAANKELVFSSDFELLNFTSLEEGTLLAQYNGDSTPFSVTNDQGFDIFDQFFILIDNEIRVKKEIIPSMFTKNKQVINQDCLGYIMKKINI